MGTTRPNGLPWNREIGGAVCPLSREKAGYRQLTTLPPSTEIRLSLCFQGGIPSLDFPLWRRGGALGLCHVRTFFLVRDVHP